MNVTIRCGDAGDLRHQAELLATELREEWGASVDVAPADDHAFQVLVNGETIFDNHGAGPLPAGVRVLEALHAPPPQP